MPRAETGVNGLGSKGLRSPHMPSPELKNTPANGDAATTKSVRLREKAMCDRVPILARAALP